LQIPNHIGGKERKMSDEPSLIDETA